MQSMSRVSHAGSHQQAVDVSWRVAFFFCDLWLCSSHYPAIQPDDRKYVAEAAVPARVFGYNTPFFE